MPKLMEKKATEGVKIYDDLMMRDNINDKGEIPSAGALCHSPDIIPQGSRIVENPKAEFVDKNWDKDVGLNISANTVNYIYVRGINNGSKPEEGNIYLHYSLASLLLWPTDPLDPKKGWKNQKIMLSDEVTDHVTVKADGKKKFVGNEPFKWVPVAPPANDHYCMVSRVETKRNPNPVPDPSNLSSFAKYVSEHPNVAWRNVVVVNPENPVSTASVGYNQGNQAKTVRFQLECINAPVGAEVAFTSATPGPVPPLEISKTKITNPDRFIVGTFCDIPAKFSTKISYTFYSNGLRPTKPMKIRLVAYYLPISNEKEVYRYGKKLHEFGIDHEMARQALKYDGLEPITGIVLGTHEMHAGEQN